MNDQKLENASEATATDVAQWMLSEVSQKKRIYQSEIAPRIRKGYGSSFVYENKNGNLSISKEVLEEFRTLSDGLVIWEKGERCWRLLRKGEEYKGRQRE